MSKPGGGVLQRIGHYTVAKVAIMLAGFVSYPILTRVLSPAEYGIMGFTIVILNVLIAFSKLGLQFSTVRLWPLWDDTEEKRGRFLYSFFAATLIASLVTLALYDTVVGFVGPHLKKPLAFYLLLSSPLVVIRAFTSYGLSVLQAQQRSIAYAVFEGLVTYASMILAVVGAVAILRGLTGYYAGLMAGEALVTVGLAGFVFLRTTSGTRRFTGTLFREAVAFGLPLAIYEMSGVLFYTGDRIVIKNLLDEDQLGYYTVAFNLVQYIHQIFTIPVVLTVQPAVTSLFEKEGPESASAFLKKAARLYIMFALAAVAGLALVREDLLVLLASKRFLPGAALLHILVAGFMLSGSRDIVGAGFFLKKRPWHMAGLNLSGAALNTGLNLLLIPRFGIQGAAFAIFGAQFTMTLVFWILGSRLVPVGLDLVALLKHVACVALMFYVVGLIDPGAGIVRLGLRVAAGAAIYGVAVAAVDGEARELVLKVWARVRGR
jgi:O-antigen/teichoic acid export membrane protein